MVIQKRHYSKINKNEEKIVDEIMAILKKNNISLASAKRISYAVNDIFFAEAKLVD